MDPGVLVAVALVALGVALILNLMALRKARDHDGAPRNRTMMGGAAVLYAVAALVLLIAAFLY